ncbi:M23 family metallopeptidase [Jiangella aurantiaca]|uniref:M23 family metallopeptidase n=1 Tax=Jiangella aurantiaca TaxID=2530373 RepID=A0A4R5AM69_9ACTN|nr:M23 family metallopeptidase [Jiangella aurantiaca]TDD73055.1 M23 family metallopeptidase [Jiangella aurantiaca]
MRRLTVLAVTIGVLCTGLNQAGATSDAEQRLKDAQNSLAHAQDELAHSTQALADATAAYQAATAQLPAAEASLATAEQGLAAAEHEVEVARGEVAAARAADEAAAEKLAEAEQKVEDQIAKIDDVTERIDGKRASISQVAVQAYTRGVGADLASLTILMQADSMDELAARAAASTSVLTAENSIMSDLKVDRAELANERVVLEDLEAAAEEARQLAAATLQATEQREQEAEAARAAAQAASDAAAAAKAQVDQLVAARDGAVTAAQAAQAADQQQTAAWAAERDQIEAEIAAIQQQQQEQAEQEAEENQDDGGGDGGSVTLAYPTANPYVTSPYGMRVHPVTGIYKLHDGTDFRAYCGTPIRAAAAGTVEWAYYRGAYGNQVAISHRRMVTTYSHLSRFAVSDGESVSQGEVIGYSGTTGSSTACHLHFMLYVGGERVNPMNHLGR